MQHRNTHPLGFAVRIHASILHTNLGKWPVTVNYYVQLEILISKGSRKVYAVLVLEERCRTKQRERSTPTTNPQIHVSLHNSTGCMNDVVFI